MSNTLKVAAIQMNCMLGEVAHNLSVCAKMISKAAGDGAKLIVVPEFFDTAYRVEERDHELADTIPGRTTEYLVDMCKEKNIYIVGAQIERSVDVLYDTAYLCGPDGVIGTYRKNALWGTESERFSKGPGEYFVYDIGFCKVGLQICYEIGFPEGARILALRGADIIAYPSAFGKARLYAWDLASRSRALENGCYVIACNRTGEEKNETVFAGSSRIVSPKGDVLALAEDEFEIITAEVNLEAIREQRKNIPYLKDLRPQEIAKNYLQI